MRGNRRQTNPNRLKNIIIEFIKENIKTYLILTIIFFIGLTLGVIFVNNANETQANQISGYINNLRLNHAIQLLNEHPNYTMKAIAEDSGFNSMPTFNNLFKKKTGMTPFEFKSAQKE